MQQLPPAICTVPVNGTAAVVETSSGVIAVGVAEAIGVVGRLDPCMDEMGVSVIADGTSAKGGVRLAA